ncbi:NAD(P)-dependent oxidoreductase [uncultured Tessaracoccus sp.]|uniref:NAD-dependent epimerase/dehydratase family protein n=1 Tax=uncultured Tessaracoccus sp. TaxID=905023 RepID=UPI0025FE440C|nr:NAD(P)-dependent oxidoreductase [uncultured Tessaracoccus sp.]
MSTAPRIVVTGANGLVGSHVCKALAERGARVRAVVRREGAAPELPGVEEVVGEFHDPATAARICEGAAAVVQTVHPMRDDHLQTASVGWSAQLATAARDAGVARYVHVSTTSVYEREESTGDVDEHSKLVDDDARDYAVTKRDTDDAVRAVDGITRILVHPTAILGPGEWSVWNVRRPQAIRDEASARRDDPDRTFGWVHVDDLAALIADLATGRIPTADDPDQGPVEGSATSVNAVAGNVPYREYLAPVAAAMGVEPEWERRPAFRAKLLANRARTWGWEPTVTFEAAMQELLDGLR